MVEIERRIDPHFFFFVVVVVLLLSRQTRKDTDFLELVLLTDRLRMVLVGVVFSKEKFRVPQYRSVCLCNF